MKVLYWVLFTVVFCLPSAAWSAPKTEQWTMSLSYVREETTKREEKDEHGTDKIDNAAHFDAQVSATFEIESHDGNYQSVKLLKMTGTGSKTITHTRRMKEVDDSITTTIDEDFKTDGTFDASKTDPDACRFVAGRAIIVTCQLHFTTNHDNHTKKVVDIKGGRREETPTANAGTQDEILYFMFSDTATPDMIKQKHWSGTRVEKITNPQMLALGTQGTTTMTVDIHGAAPPVELVVEPDGYAAWVPKANLADPTKSGSQIAVRATLKTKSGKPLPLDMFASKITFKLKNGSQLPGVATNYPAESKDTKYDLRIVQADNPDDLKVDPDEQGAHKDGPTNVAGANISSFDFGGWSDLEVTAYLPDGTKVVGHLAGKPEGAFALPKRKDGSKIAESWSKSNGGKADEIDDDPKPVGNGFAGDGFTMFEEYRGIVCGGKHTRMDPKKKDLLVMIDNAIRSDAAKGLGYFKAGTQLDVHECTSADELPASRDVTSNHGAGAHHVDQHGIFVEATDASAGEAENIGTPAAGGHIVLEKPKTTPREREEWDATVAHEIGHACNVMHHGDGDRFPVYWVQRPDGQLIERATEKNGIGSNLEITVVDENGKPVPATDPILSTLLSDSRQKIYVSVPKGEMSGDENCFMRYATEMHIDSAYVDIIKDRNDPKVRRWIPKNETVGTKMCSSNKGKNVNAANHKPYRWHDDAARGNCVHQFVVNDAYKP